MNEDILKGKWNQFEGEIQKEWGKFTQNDLDQIKAIVFPDSILIPEKSKIIKKIN